MAAAQSEAQPQGEAAGNVEERRHTNDIRQLVSEKVGGIISVSGGPSVTEPKHIAALASLAAHGRAAAPESAEPEGKNARESWSTRHFRESKNAYGQLDSTIRSGNRGH